MYLQGQCNRYSLQGWRLLSGVSTLQYSLASDDQSPPAGCTLTVSVLGNFLILAALTGDSDIHQLTFSLREHAKLRDSAAQPGHSESAAVHFPNQQEAGALVKDTLVLPIKTALCRAAGRPLPLSLLQLPSELRDRCLQNLQASMTAFACTLRSVLHGSRDARPSAALAVLMRVEAPIHSRSFATGTGHKHKRHLQTEVMLHWNRRRLPYTPAFCMCHDLPCLSH